MTTPEQMRTVIRTQMDVVLQSGVPIAILPLDVTHKATITTPRMDVLRQQTNANGSRLAGILQSYERFDTQKFGLEGGPLHDPVTVAYLLRPELFGGKACNVRIEHASELTMGQTVADWWGVSDLPANATVMTTADVPA